MSLALLQKFETCRNSLSARYNLNAQSVTMHHVTLRNLMSCYPLDFREATIKGVYFRGVKVFASSDVELDAFYFSHQL